MEKWEQFIKQLDQAGVPLESVDDDNANLTIDKYEAMRDQLLSGEIKINIASFTSFDPKTIESARQSLGALMSDKPTLPLHIKQGVRVLMCASLTDRIPYVARYLSRMNDDAIEMMYIEDMRRVYSDELVNRWLEEARTTPRSFYHCVKLYELNQRLATPLDQLRDVFTAIANQLGKALARGFADVPNSAQPNRSERRSAKYGKRRKKESDQQWARRNNRKRRN